MFTKGQKVTFVSLWTEKTGQFTVRNAVVYSCGKKQMVLTDEDTGEELGRNFKPTPEQYSGTWVVARLEGDDALSFGAAMSQLWIDQRAANLRKIMEGPLFSQQAKVWQDDVKESLAKYEALKGSSGWLVDVLAAARAARAK